MNGSGTIGSDKGKWEYELKQPGQVQSWTPGFNPPLNNGHPCGFGSMSQMSYYPPSQKNLLLLLLPVRRSHARSYKKQRDSV